MSATVLGLPFNALARGEARLEGERRKQATCVARRQLPRERQWFARKDARERPLWEFGRAGLAARGGRPLWPLSRCARFAGPLANVTHFLSLGWEVLEREVNLPILGTFLQLIRNLHHGCCSVCAFVCPVLVASACEPLCCLALSVSPSLCARAPLSGTARVAATSFALWEIPYQILPLTGRLFHPQTAKSTLSHPMIKRAASQETLN